MADVVEEIENLSILLIIVLCVGVALYFAKSVAGFSGSKLDLGALLAQYIKKLLGLGDDDSGKDQPDNSAAYSKDYTPTLSDESNDTVAALRNNSNDVVNSWLWSLVNLNDEDQQGLDDVMNSQGVTDFRKDPLSALQAAGLF